MEWHMFILGLFYNCFDFEKVIYSLPTLRDFNKMARENLATFVHIARWSRRVPIIVVFNPIRKKRCIE